MKALFTPETGLVIGFSRKEDLVAVSILEFFVEYYENEGTDAQPIIDLIAAIQAAAPPPTLQ